MKTTLLPILVLALGAGAHSARGAEDSELSLGVGLNYSTGEYGTSATTRILSIPLTAQYETGRWKAKLTVPYLRISGPANVIPGVGAVNNTNPNGRGRGSSGGTSTSEGTASGLGDIVTALTYNAYYNQAAKFGIDVTGKVKFGTADRDRGLGTGENDYFAQVDAYKTFDRITAFGGIGRAWLGSSAFIQLNNVWYANAGASYALDQRDSVGLSFDARQRASASSAPQREMTAFWIRKLDKATKAQAYMLVGLANGSPDWGFGVSVAHAF